MWRFSLRVHLFVTIYVFPMWCSTLNTVYTLTWWPIFTDTDVSVEGYALYHGDVEGNVLDLYDYELAKCAQKCAEDTRCKGFTYGEIPQVFCFTKGDISQPPIPKPDLFGIRTYVKRHWTCGQCCWDHCVWILVCKGILKKRYNRAWAEIFTYRI